jgi:hypothetical protein
MSILSDKVVDGASFPEFAMECSRSFMPLISLRDTPEAPIPTRIEPDTRQYERVLRESRIRKAEIESMSREETQAAVEAEVSAYEQRMEELRRELRHSAGKLRAMRAEAEAWTPPTPEHAALKQYMIEQLDREIEWQDRKLDGDELARIDGQEWQRRMLSKIDAEIAHAEEQIKKERSRAESATIWLRQLRESLTP